MVAQPHFLLFCDTHHSDNQHGDPRQGPYAGSGGGRWHFVLEQLDGPERLEAADSEATVNRERLALLSVVRGLEALEQPSQVTLVTTSRYVSRGLRYGLSSWREADYMWERFGEQRPVRNSDLWRRVDTAMQFHGVKCRLIQAAQAAVAEIAGPASTGAKAATTLSEPTEAVQPEFTRPLTHRLAASPGTILLGNAASRPSTAAASPSTARDLRYPSGIWQPPRRTRPDAGLVANWWNLALAWLRWWRGRLLAKPAYFGT